jgi:hypothetical protein
MKLKEPFKYIGRMPVEPFHYRINKLPKDIWDKCDYRQISFNVHKNTKSIVILFDGYLDQMLYDLFKPVLIPEIDRMAAGRIYKLHRIIIANLPAGEKIDTHIDEYKIFDYVRRFHLVLKTNKDVDFYCGGEIKNLKRGEVWEISNRDKHNVVNRGTTDRWHLIFDLEYYDERTRWLGSVVT